MKFPIQFSQYPFIFLFPRPAGTLTLALSLMWDKTTLPNSFFAMTWNQTKEKVSVQVTPSIQKGFFVLFHAVDEYSYLVVIFDLTASVFRHFSFSQQLMLLFTHPSRDSTAILSHQLLIDANMQRKQNFTLL